MRAIGDIEKGVVESISTLLFDIDDTFTLDGKIPEASFSALWSLKRAGIQTVPITGRPAGWCDHIARMWPVSGVVGENGALYFYYDEKKKKLERRFFIEPGEIEKKRRELKSIGDEILKKVPGTAYASDQPYRLFDIAIDFTEDVPPLSSGDIQKICDIFTEHKVNYKVSSIHVNGWFGDYDKLTMTKIFAKEVLGVDIEENRERFIFFGDSPNDEPMFRFFSNSVGVANVRKFLDLIKHPPAYVTEREGGEGFSEAVEIILSKRDE
jgi:HAD superfamily hydrolase (TIGR01484 family)